MVRIILDVMGGDNCPDCNIDGALLALKRSEGISLILCGPEELIRKKLKEKKAELKRIEVLNAPEVITTEESPVEAIRKKQNSGIVRGILAVKEKQADAFISAGSSGAILAAGQLRLGRIRGVLRPPLATLIPTENGVSLLLDSGANLDAKAEWLVQFAKMGAFYMEAVLGVKEPSVKLVNVGLEEEKGNQLVKETRKLLEMEKGLRFLGYAEAREIPYHTADVIVTDAFTGNAILKTLEGTAGLLLKTVKSVLMTNLKTKFGALLIKDELKSRLRSFDASEYGGAPLLGVKGAVIKCHGNATEKEICNAILQAEQYIGSGMNDRIAKEFEKV